MHACLPHACLPHACRTTCCTPATHPLHVPQADDPCDAKLLLPEPLSPVDCEYLLLLRQPPEAPPPPAMGTAAGEGALLAALAVTEQVCVCVRGGAGGGLWFVGG